VLGLADPKPDFARPGEQFSSTFPSYTQQRSAVPLYKAEASGGETRTASLPPLENGKAGTKICSPFQPHCLNELGRRLRE